MLTDPSARRRLRLTLIAISLATIPCYCVGLFAASLAPKRGVLPPATFTSTPTITFTPTASATATLTPRPLLPSLDDVDRDTLGKIILGVSAVGLVLVLLSLFRKK